MDVKIYKKVSLLIIFGAILPGILVAQTTPGSLRVNDLEVVGTITTETIESKHYVLGEDGWYRFVKMQQEATGSMSTGKIRIFGSHGNSQETDITFYVGGSSWWQESTDGYHIKPHIYIINNGAYNNSHVRRIRCGHVREFNETTYKTFFVVDVNFTNITYNSTVTIATDSANTLPLCDEIEYNPSDLEGRSMTVRGNIIGGGYTMYNHCLGLGDGNVGIGIDVPARKLHVRSVMRLQPLYDNDRPQDGALGDIYFSRDTGTLMVHDGTAWKKVMLTDE